MVRVYKLPKALNMIDERGFSRILFYLINFYSKRDRIRNNFMHRLIGRLAYLVVICLLLCYALGSFWWWYVNAVRNDPYTDAIFYESKSNNEGENPDI